jgi:ABC-type multidrug transport system ATPase subunit
MDQKLKNYSSGMQVRLAFSIAIRANSDILLIDEVLAVGDASFQQKCNDYFEKQKASGQTIVLVTHDMASVEKYCSRAILIEDGKITLEGSPEKVADRYTETNQRSIDKQITIDNMSDEHPDVETYVVNRDGDRINSVAVGDYIYLVMKWKGQGVENIGIGVNKQSGERMYKTNTQYDKTIIQGRTATCKLKMNVAPGKYYFGIRLYGKNDLDTKVMIENGPLIIVTPVRTHKFGGLVPLEHTWE